jgi:hypothetical protein
VDLNIMGIENRQAMARECRSEMEDYFIWSQSPQKTVASEKKKNTVIPACLDHFCVHSKPPNLHRLPNYGNHLTL